MGYVAFDISKIRKGPATVATVATLQDGNRQTVANVAIVAKPEAENRASDARSVANVATVARGELKKADLQEAELAPLTDEQDERAAILEYDEGLPRDEAERLAQIQVPVAPPPITAPREPKPGPGISITAPAVAVSAAEYDRRMDALISVAINGVRGRLEYAKKRGFVAEDVGGRFYMRGRT